jgi:hypothetical protein
MAHIYLYFLCTVMIRPIKYEGIRRAFEKKEIKELEEITEELRAAKIAEVLGINYNRVTRCLSNPWKFTAEELFLISNHVEVKAKDVTDLVETQYRKAANGSTGKLPIIAPAKPKKKKTK